MCELKIISNNLLLHKMYKAMKNKCFNEICLLYCFFFSFKFLFNYLEQVAPKYRKSTEDNFRTKNYSKYW